VFVRLAGLTSYGADGLVCVCLSPPGIFYLSQYVLVFSLMISISKGAKVCGSPPHQRLI
jgi:hypothetical protein